MAIRVVVVVVVRADGVDAGCGDGLLDELAVRAKEFVTHIGDLLTRFPFYFGLQLFSNYRRHGLH